MENIKGMAYFYDPGSKTVKEIEIEASVEVEWEEMWLNKTDRTYFAYPWALAKCPYDGEELRFDIIFDDDTSDNMPEGESAGGCIHFAPKDFLRHTGRWFDEMLPALNDVEEGFIYLKETKEEFADRMGWEVQEGRFVEKEE